MNPLHRKKLGIQDGHRIVQRDIKVEASDTHVTSVYWYDEIDEEGEFVGGHVLRETNFIQKTTPQAPRAPHNGDKDRPDGALFNALRSHPHEHRTWLHSVLPRGRHKFAV
ncbi:MAG: hypothetical protein ABI893_16670 [Polaromonas sp.]|uniref:hypothetical protein n=1 Tax=Polaromonas sp. TaxID=1869339 RepID=UPI0032650D74